MKYFVLFFTVGVFFSCHEKVIRADKNPLTLKDIGLEKEMQIIFPEELITREIENVMNKAEYLLIVYFDGGCSYCILKFLELVTNMVIKNNYGYIYIVSAHDLELVEYFLEANGKIMGNNEFLICDKTGEFAKQNNTIVIDLNPLIITDKDLHPVAGGSIFSFSKELINHLL